MIENLSKLYNTLLLIETKGSNTKTMAQCLQFIENMIAELASEQSTSTDKE